jgi:CRISPR-associated endonuclease Csn1
MQKIFSLDLGVASIGWAAVLQDPDNEELNEILDCGVRIVPLDSDEIKEFGKGGNVPTNVARRMARGMRRNLQRFKLRRHLLYRALTHLGMMPDERLLRGLPPRELFALRDRALHAPLSLPELGRVLLLLNLRRGFKSNRKAASDKEESAYKEAIKAREADLDAKGQTIGQAFAEGLRQDAHFRVRQKLYNRATYIEEFDLIWAVQAPHHPAVLTEQNRRWLRDKVIYRQRPLKSAKHLVGECALEWNYAVDKRTQQPIVQPNGMKKVVRPKCAPKSSPLAQECKAWESIHNLRVYDEKGQPLLITDEHKRQIFNTLQQEEKNLSATRILKDILKVSPKTYTVDALVKEKGIESNRTRAKLLAVFQATGINRRDLLEFNPAVETVDWDNPDTGERLHRLQLRGDFDQQPLYQLWHLIYATQEEKDLVRLLQERYGFTEAQAEALAQIDFTSAGYASKSHRAMRRLLPHYQRGLDYTDACKTAGYNHSNSLTKAENEGRVLMERLDLNTILPKNSLRNPVVEKILGHMINLVNALLEAYGQPDEIRLELARELRQSAKERQDTTRHIGKREKENKRIRSEIADLLKIQPESVTRAQIEKYRLYEETDGHSIYTGQKTDLAAFLNGDMVDVEHVIPRVRRFDDSFSNKTLCERKLNQDKGNWTAYDFMKAQPVQGLQSFEAYQKMLKTLLDSSKISKTKYRNLMLSAEDLAADKDNFLARQLKETQYITKKAREILLDVSRQVLTTTGGITDFLRHEWGWDEVIQDSRLPQFREIGKTKIVHKHKGTQEKEVIEDWDKRKDHRHHALDALVVACTRRAHIKRINDLNQTLEGTQGQERRDRIRQIGRAKYLAGPAPFTYAQVAEAVEQVLISFKQGQKVASRSKNRPKSNKKPEQITLTPRGSLHEETVYGRLRQYQKVPINTRFDPTWVDEMPHAWQRTLVQARLEQFEGDPKKAFKGIEKKPILYGTGNDRQLKEVTIWRYSLVSRKPVGPLLSEKSVGKIVDPLRAGSRAGALGCRRRDLQRGLQKCGRRPGDPQRAAHPARARAEPRREGRRIAARVCGARQQPPHRNIPRCRGQKARACRHFLGCLPAGAPRPARHHPRRGRGLHPCGGLRRPPPRRHAPARQPGMAVCGVPGHQRHVRVRPRPRRIGLQRPQKPEKGGKMPVQGAKIEFWQLLVFAPFGNRDFGGHHIQKSRQVQAVLHELAHRRGESQAQPPGSRHCFGTGMITKLPPIRPKGFLWINRHDF